MSSNLKIHLHLNIYFSTYILHITLFCCCVAMWSFLRNTLSMSVCRGDIFGKEKQQKRKEKKYFRRVSKIYLNVIISVVWWWWSTKHFMGLQKIFLHKVFIRFDGIAWALLIKFITQFIAFYWWYFMVISCKNWSVPGSFAL